MKKITHSELVGAQGVALVALRVAKMEFLWHETGGVEAGTDGFVEIRDPLTTEVLSSVFKVQSKATENGRAWQREDEHSFEFPCKQKDIDYWLAGNVPVVIVCSDVQRNLAYWKEVSSYFREPGAYQSRRIKFSKHTDGFDTTAANALMALAVERTAGMWVPPVPRSEELLSNLLEVTGYGAKVWVAPAQCPSTYALQAELQKENVGLECFVRDGNVIGFQRLDGPPWHRVCDTNAAEAFDTDEWAHSDEEERRREFVELLNRSLLAKVRPEMNFDPKLNLYYFKASEDRSDVVLPSGRRVFRSYFNKRDGSIIYYRHSGFHAHFVQVDERWHLEITPDYLFTNDGSRVSRFNAENRKKIKRIEHNDAVRQQVVAFARYLGRPSSLLDEPYEFLQFGELCRFSVEFGFDESQWAASAEEESHEDELFEAA